jgi:hypothetical protein
MIHSPKRLLIFPLAAFQLFLTIGICSGANDRLSDAKDIQKSPDVSISDTFGLASSPAVVDKLMTAPLLMAQLWKVYDFRPQYQIRMNGEAIHVDDPTGITGDLYLVERTNTRRVYLGIGALNHALVPNFKGKMALVLTVNPDGSRSKMHADVFIRTNSRILGFLARTFISLVKARMMNRITLNAKDFSTLSSDISSAPARVAAKLRKEDGNSLLNLISR